MKLLNRAYPSSRHRISNQSLERKVMSNSLLCSKDIFQKSHSKPLHFAGTPIPQEDLIAFYVALFNNSTPEKACEIVRNGGIPVNGELGEPIHGQPRSTLFEWLLREYSSLELLREMVQAGANLQKEDQDGYFPVHRVAMKWPPEALQILVDGGANVNQLDRDGLTALHYAANLHDGLDVAIALIENGAAIVEPESGHKLLCTAIRKGSVHVNAGTTTQYNLPTIVDLLLAHGTVFPNEQAREDYLSLLKEPAYNAYFKQLPYGAIKRHVQHDLPHPDEPRPLNQQFPDTADHRNYQRAVREVFREFVQKQGPSHPLYYLYRRKPRKSPEALPEN